MNRPIDIVIPLNPRSKKNSQQIFKNKQGRPFITQSKIYKQFEQDCGAFLAGFYNLGINAPINLKCVFYRVDRRKCDITNLLNATQDILVKYGVIEDDNFKIVESIDGSRIKYDKENPRTEITITFH